jgi:uncharacterized membrane protein YbaN (DUF454 family)
MADYAANRSAGRMTAPTPPIEVMALPGAVRIVSPELFSRGDEAIVPRLFERLLAVKAVEALEVDRGRGVVIVTCGSPSLPASELLSQLAAATRSDRACGWGAPPREIDLRTIPGRVTRIERHRHARWGLTTIFSVGAGLRTSYSKFIRRATGNSPGGNSPGENPTVSNGSAGACVVLPGGLTVHFQPQQAISGATEPHGALGDPGAFHRMTEVDAGGELSRGNGARQVVVAQGIRRLAHLTAAGGCFVMSFVGLVTPGVPTVPFVLATSYFLVRSSPTLDDRLRRSRLFGQMVRDWEAYGGMRRSTKTKIIVLTLAIVVVTILIADPSLPLLAVITVMGTLGVGLILQFRTVAEESPDSLAAFAPA